jgi:asparagine synthetase B (glutamine-hydrolysing)
VIASANALPSDRKYNNKTGKIPLKSSFNDLLPRSVFEGPKKGFEVPLNTLINSHLKRLKESIASSESLRQLGMNSDALIRVSSGQDTQLQWHLIVLHHWLTNTQHHPLA